MKKTFDINRFWHTLKWTLISEKKSIITAFIAFTVGFLAIQLFSFFTIFDINHGLGPAATMTGMGTCSAILGFMAAYYASGILGNARTTQQRTTALMLPASNLEKFVVRIVYCCIGMLVVLYLAALAATGLRMLLELIAGHDQITAGLGILFGYGEQFGSGQIDDEISFGPLFPIAITLWPTSLFVLGGVFFRKRPFVWTNVTLFLTSLLLFTLIFYIVVLIGEERVDEFLSSIIYKDMTPRCFFNWVSVVLGAFTVLNVWLSYRFFCRLQVVQHKWFNV